MLYQPTNITPSTFAGLGGGVIDATDEMAVTWQICGTSPMTAYRIVFYTNDGSGTTVFDTSKVALLTPFYGTDANGDPVFFTYSSGDSWSNAGFANGHAYKLNITQYWDENGTEQSVSQYSDSAFFAKDAPVVTLGAVSETSVKETFTATYLQTQGDGINFVRWVLTDNTVGRVVKDTGNVTTGVLSFTYDGLFDGHDYTVSVTVQSSSGVSVTDEADFTVAYTELDNSGTITVNGADDGSVLLEWGKARDIQATVTGGTISDDMLTLNAGENVVWDTVDGESMALDGLQFVAWKGASTANDKSYGAIIDGSSNVHVATHPSKDFGVVLSLSVSPYLHAFTADASGFTDLGAITGETSGAWRGVFSPDGSVFVTVRGNAAANGINVYSVDTSGSVPVFTFVSDISSQIAGVSGKWFDAAFSPDGTVLVVGGDYGAVWFTVSGTVFTYQGLLPVVPGMQWDGNVLSAAFSEDGGVLIIGSDVSGSAYSARMYAFDGSAFTFLDSFSDWRRVNAIGFIPNTSLVVFAGQNNYTGTSGACLYSYLGDQLTYVRDLVTAYGAYLPVMNDCAVSPDGKTLVLAGNGGAFLFSLDGTGATFARTALSATNARGCAFGNDGDLYIGGGLSAGNDLYFEGLGAENVLADLAGTGIVLSRKGIYYTASFGGNTFEVPVISDADGVLLTLNGERFTLYAFRAGDPAGSIYVSVSDFPEGTLTSVTMVGYQICDYLYLSENGAYDIPSVDFVPYFDGDTLFYASFKDGYQAGTVSASGNIVNAVYRDNGEELVPIAVTPTAYTALKDYGVKAGETYTYHLYYNNGSVFSSQLVSDPVCFKPRFYLLVEAERDANDRSVYHAVRSWKFGSNIESGDVSNGNEPNMMKNFTPYPFRQPSAYRAKSGTLSALLSNPSSGKYADTAAEMDRLFEISQSPNVFFLRDMKGNFRMVHTSGAVSMGINEKSEAQEVKVNVPWVEVGSSQGVSVIQMPADGGWNENQVLSVRLDVEPDSGMLGAKYPKNYVGSVFSLNRPSLISTVPDGMKDAKYTIDGSELNAELED